MNLPLLNLDLYRTPLAFEKVWNPSWPWYWPIPDGPTPPKGISSWVTCTRVSLITRASRMGVGEQVIRILFLIIEEV